MKGRSYKSSIAQPVRQRMENRLMNIGRSNYKPKSLLLTVRSASGCILSLLESREPSGRMLETAFRCQCAPMFPEEQSVSHLRRAERQLKCEATLLKYLISQAEIERLRPDFGGRGR